MVVQSLPDCTDLAVDISRRGRPFNLPQCLSHPLRQREPRRFGCPFVAGEILVGEDYLEALTHRSSIDHYRAAAQASPAKGEMSHWLRGADHLQLPNTP